MGSRIMCRSEDLSSSISAVQSQRLSSIRQDSRVTVQQVGELEDSPSGRNPDPMMLNLNGFGGQFGPGLANSGCR